MSQSTLTRLPLFSDLTAAELGSLTASFRRRRFPKGTVIHAADTMGTDLYVVESGRVAIQLLSEHGEPLTLRLLRPGDFFGELSLLDDEPWYGDAIAFDDCQLLMLAKRDFLDVLDRFPSVSRRLLVIVCKRLRENARFTQNLAFLDVPTRVARLLITLVESGSWGWTNAEPPSVSPLIEMSQSALAAHVGATRESVNKWLGYYERRGYISRQREGIVVLRLEELRASAE